MAGDVSPVAMFLSLESAVLDYFSFSPKMVFLAKIDMNVQKILSYPTTSGQFDDKWKISHENKFHYVQLKNIRLR